MTAIEVIETSGSTDPREEKSISSKVIDAAFLVASVAAVRAYAQSYGAILVTGAAGHVARAAA
jgi:hypothetical protein